MRVEAAGGLYLGDRNLQQDTVQILNDRQTGVCLLCLSDGIGGAGNGHLASGLIVRSAMAELKAHLSEIAAGAEVPRILIHAAQVANQAIERAVTQNLDKAGMGGTLLLVVIRNDVLSYLSIGDSLIFRLRKGKLEQLNKLHSLAASADHLVATGRMNRQTVQAAAGSTLTSALTGQELQQVELAADSHAWVRRDTLLLASDGIETLSEDEIACAISDAARTGAATAVSTLISEIEALTADGQDNVSTIVVVESGS